MALMNRESVVTLTKSSISNLNENRKRALQPSNWTDNLAKYRKNSGEPYVNRNGDAFPGKAAPQEVKVCGLRCQYEGCLLPLLTKTTLFQGFLGLESYESKRNYLFNLMERDERAGVDDYRYYFNVAGRRMQTCRKTWMDTFKIQKGVVETLQSKMAAGECFIKDGRGQHEHPIINTVAIKQRILNHINGFERFPNHYSRRHNGEFYLKQDLNVSIMFRMFSQTNPDIPQVESKETLYRTIFRETGLRIGEPKSDSCKSCDSLWIQLLSAITPEQREAAELQITTHHETTDLAYVALKNDIELSRQRDDYVVYCGDLQQVLFCPTLTHDEVFYKRQLSTYNYCIYDAKNNVGNMCLWDESVGGRGVDEIGSCLLKKIQDSFAPLPPNQQRTFVLWSDRCRGQTNNWQVLTLPIYLLSRRYFTAVEQKFLYSGHSFLPCDRLFALIEKRRKVCQAMIPEHWQEIIRNTKADNPFQIILMNQENILDIKRLEDRIPRPQDFRVTEFQQYRIESQAPHVLMAKQDYNAENWMQFRLTAPTTRRTRIANRDPWSYRVINRLILRPKYRHSLPISAEKYRDLISFLPYMMPEYHQFYRNLDHQ